MHLKIMKLDELIQKMTAWRHAFHADPEFGFEEHCTSARVCEILNNLGFEVITGIGGTGVVASLTKGKANRAIGLRADMDALRITEATGLRYASKTPGVMHACGHDGHTAMLLGAAHLIRDLTFDGTVRLIFQPAEEWGNGALAMLADGLLDRAPFEEIYGLHNMPGLPLGDVETCAGPIMSAEDLFEITLEGQGGHAARPHMGREVMSPACALVQSLQSIVARRVDPTAVAVVSVTEILTDGTRNALPGRATIKGDARSFTPEISAQIEAEMRRIAQGIATAHDLAAKVSYTREFIPLINDLNCANALVEAAIPHSNSVAKDAPPITASEDFAQFLKHVPGAFAFIGNGDTAPLHSPNYDFDDNVLIHGAQIFTEIVKTRLAP